MKWGWDVADQPNFEKNLAPMRKLSSTIPSLLLSAALCLLLALSGLAQTTEPWLGLVPEVEHNEGELEGMTTYRLYLYTPSEDDFLYACSGYDDQPLVLESTATPAWFQSEFATSPFPIGINADLIDFFPELEFDSWLTLGWTPESEGSIPQILGLSDTGILSTQTTFDIDTLYLADTLIYDTLGFTIDTLEYIPPYDMFAEFEMGNNVNAAGPIGNSWFTLPELTNTTAFAGEDLRICVAQLTTAGEISGQMLVSARLNFTASADSTAGDSTAFENFEALLPILMACNDPNASNYEPQSFSSDGCKYEVDGVNDLPINVPLKVYPTPASHMVAVDLPLETSRQLSSGSLTLTALDGRLVGSWNLQGRQTHLDVSNLPSGQYILSVHNADGEPTVHRTTLLVAH